MYWKVGNTLHNNVSELQKQKKNQTQFPIAELIKIGRSKLFNEVTGPEAFCYFEKRYFVKKNCFMYFCFKVKIAKQ